MNLEGQLRVATAIQAIGAHVRRTAPHGPRRWAIDVNGTRHNGRTIDAVFRSIIKARGQLGPALLSITELAERAGGTDAVVEALLVGPYFTAYGRHIVGVMPKSVAEDRMARGDKLTRRRMARRRRGEEHPGRRMVIYGF